MITELPIPDKENIKDFEQKLHNCQPLYIVWRYENESVLEIWGCDTRDEVQEKWTELKLKAGKTVVTEYRPKFGPTNGSIN